MTRFWLALALAAGMATAVPSHASAQGGKPPARAIHMMTPNAWFLTINSDGSGRLQFGSSAMDGWGFKAGTFDAKKVEKDLQALNSDAKGGNGTHFVIHFEAERKGPDDGPPARYTRDIKVIPMLYQRAIDASEGALAGRKAELLKKYPPGLPKEK
jgi:hypothetical protein